MIVLKNGFEWPLDIYDTLVENKVCGACVYGQNARNCNCKYGESFELSEVKTND